MSLSIVIPPYAEPIHLNEMKGHLKQDVSMTEDDLLIGSQITAARDIVETATGANVQRNHTMVATTFDLSLHCFPSKGWIPFPRVPLVSVASVSYVDTAGVAQTFGATLYTVDIAHGVIWLAYGQYWPYPRYQANAVTVRFVAGMVAPFTVVASTDVLTIWGRAFTVGDRVRLMNSGGSLPAGLLANTDYFVIAGGKLSLTSGGSAVDITGTGSGTHFIGQDLTGFETLRNAIKLVVGKLYTGRGDGGGTGAGSTDTTQRAIDSLVASVHAG